LRGDTIGAFRRTVGRVEAVMKAHDIGDPLLMAAATMGRESIHAVHYARADRAPTLYIGHSTLDGQPDVTGPGVIVLSKPLDSDTAGWREIGMSRFVTACGDAFNEEDSILSN
jgi:hypothetical protein